MTLYEQCKAYKAEALKEWNTADMANAPTRFDWQMVHHLWDVLTADAYNLKKKQKWEKALAYTDSVLPMIKHHDIRQQVQTDINNLMETEK